MKITKPGFFWHVASANAISLGWDFETELKEVYADKPEELTKDVWVYNNTDLAVTEADVLAAANGIVTPAFEAFFTHVASRFPSDIDVNLCVLQSMHSGSSDYLFVCDVLEMINS